MKKFQMKNVFIAFLLVVVLCCTFVACTAEHVHKADSAWRYDDNGHWHNCVDCSEKLNYSSHDWNAGVLTRAPTPQADGEKTFTCKVCRKTRTESVPYVAEHKAGEEWVYSGSDGLYHWHICAASGCTEHIYDRQEHTFVNKSNSDVHWKECSVCGVKKEEKATVTFDGMDIISDSSVEVDVNGVILDPPMPSVDGYSFEGWYTKTVFSSENKFDFATSVTKNLTLYARFVLIETGHQKEYQWDSDENYHWHNCVVHCSDHQYDKSEHDYSIEKSEGGKTWVECSVCGRNKDNPYVVLSFYDGENEMTSLRTDVLYGRGIKKYLPQVKKVTYLSVGTRTKN